MAGEQFDEIQVVNDLCACAIRLMVPTHSSLMAWFKSKNRRKVQRNEDRPGERRYRARRTRFEISKQIPHAGSCFREDVIYKRTDRFTTEFQHWENKNELEDNESEGDTEKKGRSEGFMNIIRFKEPLGNHKEVKNKL